MRVKIMEDVPNITKNDMESGAVDMVISLINKKWDSVRDLNSIILTLSEYDMDAILPILEEVLQDENNHIGQLQHIVETLSPSASNIDVGKNEAEQSLGE